MTISFSKDLEIYASREQTLTFNLMNESWQGIREDE